jgi:hypothetical protein
MFGGMGGAVFHDLKLAEIGFFHVLPEDKWAMGDLGYYGAERCITPIKRKKKEELTEEEKKVNALIGGICVDVERIIGQFKKFYCLAQPWRHKRCMHPIIFGVIGEIINLEIEYGLLKI